MAMKKVWVIVALAATGAALVASPVRPTQRRESAVVGRMSWQPNEDYNTFGRTNSLTDFERSARDAGATDRKVTIRKPLGLVLDANRDGDVYVKEVVKGGNADAVGNIKQGDIVAMCSATFGGEMWSTRGVGLDRVVRAIEVRAGKTVSLVLQSKSEQKNFLSGLFKNQEQIRENKIKQATQLRNELEAEIKAERDEAAKKWFGLF